MKLLSLLGYSVEVTKRREKIKKIKYSYEYLHWQKSFLNYQKWYAGELKTLWGENSPEEKHKIKNYANEFNAILTWQKLHQKPKYLEDLQLDKNVFSGLTILDIGSGPHPSALAFENCKVYCLDPLLPEYLKIGFPFHLYEDRLKFTYGHSEKMPFNDNFFDAVISVNAIDHVDDFFKTSKEMERVLKPGGKLRMHIHYHKKTATEPLELNDPIVKDSFNWCVGLKKIAESRRKKGHNLTTKGESYCLWSNF